MSDRLEVDYKAMYEAVLVDCGDANQRADVSDAQRAFYGERAEAAEAERDEAVKLLRDYPFPSSAFTDYENSIANFLARSERV